MVHESLTSTAQAMVAPGRGILAADESVATISKRFATLGIESTKESRRRYRELLLGAPGIADYLSGVILHEETLAQRGDDGRPFAQLLAERQILCGIKVDVGTARLAGTAGELVTEGLDGLRERIAAYRAAGARFAKWRAVISVSPVLPSPTCVASNAHALARYAALCQEGGLVPIVEPEVLMDGTHDIARANDVTHELLAEVFAQLRLARVDLAAMVLKPSMVLAGADAPAGTIAQVASATVGCLHDVVPAAVPGIAFLSGGQAPLVATANLDAMVRLGPHPWTLTFSYGRALQDDALRTWGGNAANVVAAQRVLLTRTARNGEAALGRYNPAADAA